eukprot:scpid26320/ scgid11913/ Importin-13
MGKERHQGYLTEIFKVLALYYQADRFLHIQLCVVAANILLRVGSSQDDEVVAMFDALKMLEATGWPNPEAYRHAVLSLLTIIPEEFSSIDISGTHRNSLRCSLQQAIPAVLELLGTSLQASFSQPASQTMQVLRCFNSWAKFGIPLNDMEPLLPTFFQLTERVELFEDCVDLLCETIVNGDSHRFPNTVRCFMSLTVGIHAHFESAVAEGRMDFCQEMSRIIVAVGENHSKLFIEWRNQEDMNVALQFIKFALQCSTLPGRYPFDEQCTDGMLYFWCRFQEDIERIDKSDLKALLWTSTFSPLLQALISKVEIPSGQAQEEMCGSDEEMFYSFRQEAADTASMISRVYFDECMTLVHDTLAQHLATGAQCSWQAVEAIFYVLRTFNDTAVHLEDAMCSESQQSSPGLHQLSNIFRQSLGQLPTEPRLQRTLYRLFCSYSEWLLHHDELIGPVLSLLVAGLQEGKLARTTYTAVDAIFEICSEGQREVVPYLDQLIAVCEGATLRKLPKCRARLFEAVCSVISSLPAQHCLLYAQQFCAPHLARLEQLATAGVSREVEEQLTSELQLLKSIFQRIDPEHEDFGEMSAQEKAAVLETHPVRVVVAGDSLWQSLNLIFQQWSSSIPVMQAACTMLQRLVLNIGEGILFRLDALQLLVAQVRDLPVIGFALELVTHLLWNFSPSCDGASSALVYQLVAHYSPLLSLLAADPSGNPDLTQSFIQMLCRVLRTVPDWVFSDGAALDAALLLTFLQSAIAVAEVPVVEQACTALVLYIEEICKRQLADHLWQYSSGDLLGNLLSALLRSAAGRQRNSLCNVLFSLYRQFPLHLKDALEAVFSSIPPFVQVPAEEKQKLFKILPRERNNRRVAREGVSAFLQAVASTQAPVA